MSAGCFWGYSSPVHSVSHAEALEDCIECGKPCVRWPHCSCITSHICCNSMGSKMYMFWQRAAEICQHVVMSCVHPDHQDCKTAAHAGRNALSILFTVPTLAQQLIIDDRSLMCTLRHARNSNTQQPNLQMYTNRNVLAQTKSSFRHTSLCCAASDRLQQFC